jgi:hypothetical protein
VYVLNNTNLIATNCTFEGNYARNSDGSANGGAVEIVNGSFTATNCKFNDNHAISENGNANGGAVSIERGHFVAKNTTFSNNSAISKGGTACGGAVNVTAHTDFIATNTTFTHDSAIAEDGSGGFGGAVRIAFNGRAYFFHCTLDENQATTAGGGVQAGGNLYSFNCIYTKNEANINEQISGKIANTGNWNLIERVNDITRCYIFGDNQYSSNNFIQYIKPLASATSARRLSMIDIPKSDYLIVANIIDAIEKDKIGQARPQEGYVSFGAVESPTLFDLIVSRNSGGSTDITNKQLSPGSQVTVSATPDRGHRFKHWECVNNSNVVSRNRQYTFTINADTNLKAVFERAR